MIICFANIQPPLSTLPTPESKVPPSPNPPLHQDPSLPITCPVAVFLNGVQKTDLEQRLLLYILCNSTFDPCQRTTKHILEKIKDVNIPSTFKCLRIFFIFRTPRQKPGGAWSQYSAGSGGRKMLLDCDTGPSVGPRRDPGPGLQTAVLSPQ